MYVCVCVFPPRVGVFVTWPDGDGTAEDVCNLVRRLYLLDKHGATDP